MGCHQMMTWDVIIWDMGCHLFLIHLSVGQSLNPISPIIPISKVTTIRVKLFVEFILRSIPQPV